MSDGAGHRRELPSAHEEPGSVPDSGGGVPQATAGALVGIATGGFLVALLAHIHIRAGWSVGAYEPAAALLGALGAWWFGPRRGARDGWVAMGAALAAMLLGDFFWTLAHTPHGVWWQVPAQALRALGWRVGRAPLPDWSVWPKILRYAFGLYIGWYVGSAVDRRSEAEQGN